MRKGKGAISGPWEKKWMEQKMWGQAGQQALKTTPCHRWSPRGPLGAQSWLWAPQGLPKTLGNSTGIKDSDSALLALGLQTRQKSPWRVNRILIHRACRGWGGTARSEGLLPCPASHLVESTGRQSSCCCPRHVADPARELLGLDEEARAQQRR